MNPIIELRDITKDYPVGDHDVYHALKGVSLKIHPGEFIAIMGPSGSGKSTLMHLMGALDTPTSGQLLFKGQEISEYSPDELSAIRNREIGFVFQSFNLLPRMTVLKNVTKPLVYAGIDTKERTKRALASLANVGLESKADNLANHISGGQIQRVAIARAMVTDPAIILADEPTGNLDTKTGEQIMELFTDLNKKGRTIVLITHEPEIAEYATRQIHLLDGLIVKDTSKKKK